MCSFQLQLVGVVQDLRRRRRGRGELKRPQRKKCEPTHSFSRSEIVLHLGDLPNKPSKRLNDSNDVTQSKTDFGGSERVDGDTEKGRTSCQLDSAVLERQGKDSRDYCAGEDEKISQEVDSRSEPTLIRDCEVVSSVFEIDHPSVVREETRDLAVGSDSAETSEGFSEVGVWDGMKGEVG